MRLHGRDVSYAVISIPETADLPACSVGSFTQDAHSSGKGLTDMRTVFVAPVVGNLKKDKGTNGAPIKACTNLVPGQHPLFPDDQHTLALCTKCVMPKGLLTSVGRVVTLRVREGS